MCVSSLMCRAEPNRFTFISLYVSFSFILSFSAVVLLLLLLLLLLRILLLLVLLWIAVHTGVCLVTLLAGHEKMRYLNFEGLERLPAHILRHRRTGRMLGTFV